MHHAPALSQRLFLALLYMAREGMKAIAEEAPGGSGPGAFPAPILSQARAEELNLPSNQDWEEKAAGWRWEWQDLQRTFWILDKLL